MRCAPFKPVKSHKFVRNILSEVIVTCPNKATGCKESFPMEKAKAHLDGCDFSIVECKAFTDCKKVDIRHEVKKHAVMCQEIRESCVYCNEKIRRREMQMHVNFGCQEY
jgi:hypothetical protein